MSNAKEFLNNNHVQITKNSTRLNIDCKVETFLSFIEVYNESSEKLNAEKLGLELEIAEHEITYDTKGKKIIQLANDVSVSSAVTAKYVGNVDSMSFDAYDFLYSIKNTKNEFLSSLRFIEEKNFEDDAPSFYESIGDIEIDKKWFWIISEKTK